MTLTQIIAGTVKPPLVGSLPSSIPGERVSVHVGCLSQREALKRRLEPKKAAAARGKGSRRRIQNYIYIEYWFHWKERNTEGQWQGRSCYLGGHPKGQSPRGKLLIRLDIVNSQYRQNRPYGETLQLMGLDGGPRQTRR